MSDNDTTGQVTALNTLTATLIDSVNGYQDAAANSEGHQFQQLFRDRATERNTVAEELRAEVRRLGGEPESDGSFMGKTHQRFLDLKAAITGRDDKAIINEVERGEDYLKEKFETALKSDVLTGDSRAAVERAFQSVRQGHDQMSQLKHGMETTSEGTAA
ncbi:MAG: PA2169 family four-helix-bundle protein [Sphingomicrobium sp.]